MDTGLGLKVGGGRPWVFLAKSWWPMQVAVPLGHGSCFHHVTVIKALHLSLHLGRRV